MASSELKDHRREQRIFLFRAAFAAGVVLLLCGVLLARYHYLQVEEHDAYQTLSDRNRMQLQSVVPTRGLITDRKQRLLAENQPDFTLSIVPEQIEDMDGTLLALGKILDISEDARNSFRKRLTQRRRPYESVPLKSRLSEEEIAFFSVDRHRFPGVYVEAELIRRYPYADLLAHVIGYVGRISERELQLVDEANYSGTQYYGKSGLEREYEDQLHGRTGFRTVEVDARGRMLRLLDQVPPQPGPDLQLYLDIDLQQVASRALGARRGAIVAIEVETGGILALVSTPAFDPNAFVTGIDTKSYQALNESLDIPLFNRAVRGQYPPGSTIKPFVALAGLDTDVVTPRSSVWDPGFYQLKSDKRKYRDWKRQGHGWVDLRTAIVQSCDVYFYDLAFKAGEDALYEYLYGFGFGQALVRDISHAKQGTLPSDEWKRANRNQMWFPGDSLNMGIGQGYMLATPLQLATATLALARKGNWVVPRLVSHVAGEPAAIPEAPPDIELQTPSDWALIFDAMEDVMHTRKGTAFSSGRDAPYRIAGKTGTAQVVGIPQGELYDEEALAERLRDHGLFVGFAPADQPRIALAVIVENGGGGSVSAAPVARQVFDQWLLPQGREALTDVETAYVR